MAILRYLGLRYRGIGRIAWSEFRRTCVMQEHREESEPLVDSRHSAVSKVVTLVVLALGLPVLVQAPGEAKLLRTLVEEAGM